KNNNEDKKQTYEKEIQDLKMTLEECKKNEKTEIKLKEEMEKFTKNMENYKESQLEENRTLKENLEKIKKINDEYKEKYDDEDDEEDNYKVTDDSQVLNFINDKLNQAIPRSARISVYNRTKKFVINKSEEISDLIPSKLLLKNNIKDGFMLKIFNEVLMTNYWQGDNSSYGLYSDWAPNTLDYTRDGNYGSNKRLKTKLWVRGQEDKIIKYSKLLYRSENEVYLDKVYAIIEKYLNDSGINCTIEKAFVPTNNPARVEPNSKEVLLAVGSLPFFNLKSKKSNINENLYYYLQVCFDIRMKSTDQIFPIRGFTMLLSDELDLYEVKD
ncbi:MAG: hypothetical protein AAGB21_03135, partial [Spiroplasma sp.]